MLNKVNSFADKLFEDIRKHDNILIWKLTKIFVGSCSLCRVKSIMINPINALDFEMLNREIAEANL